MDTQTVERRAIYHLIDGLPDSAMKTLEEFVTFLRYREHIPNAETIAAIDELRAGKGKSFASIEALIQDLHDENGD